MTSTTRDPSAAALAGDQAKQQTLTAQKLDQALLAEIDLRRKSTDAAENLWSFDILIEFTEDHTAPDSGSREEKLAEMKRMAEQSQAGLVAHLESLGVSELESLAFSNSIATVLTLEQIESVAGRDDVRRVRLRKIEKVTAATP